MSGNVKILVADIFQSSAQTLVNTVNCVGVMGKGLALEFKKRFPDMYADYSARCRRGQVRLGEPYLYRRLMGPWILNFPTKDHWRSVSRLEDIVRGLAHVEKHYREWGIKSLAVPALGCHQGQLEWGVVGPTLYRHLSQLAVPVELYAPLGTSPASLAAITSAEGVPAPDARQWVRPAWVALAAILEQIEGETYRRPIGRIMFQKIAYFATALGLPTGLEYRRGSFGPFADELKGIVTRMVNNGLIREEQLGQLFAVRVGPTFVDTKHSYQDELQQWRPLIERVADLFLRMTTTQAEVAATVHFVARTLHLQRCQKPSECEVLREVMKWKQRRRPPLDENEVAVVIRNLAALDWLEVRASNDLPVQHELSLHA